MTVTIRDTRSGNRSCDWSGDLSPTFSEVVYVCLCLFTYVWSLDLFWKLYIVPTLRDLLPLASISTSIPSYQVSLSEVDPVTGGPAYMLSPSLPLGAISGLWGNQSLQYIEANTWSPDFHIFFHSGTSPLILLKLLSATHPTFSGALGPPSSSCHTLALHPTPPAFFLFWKPPFLATLSMHTYSGHPCPHDKSSHRHTE